MSAKQARSKSPKFILVARLSDLNLRFGDYPTVTTADRKLVVIKDHFLKLGSSPDGSYDQFRVLWVLTLLAHGLQPGMVTEWYVTEGLSGVQSESLATFDIQWISSWGEGVGMANALARVAELGFEINPSAEFRS